MAPAAELAEQKLRGLHGDLVRLTRSYRAAFSTEQLPFMNRTEHPDIVNIVYQDRNDERRAILRAMTRDVRALSREPHQADQLVEASQLEQSDGSFRDLSRVLREVIRHTVSTHKSRGTDAVRDELVGLAEAALGAVVKLVSERALLVELTKTWSTIQKSPFSSLWSVTSIKELFGRLFSAGGSGETEDRPEGRALAHEDPLIFSPELFRDVLDAIASNVKSKLDPKFSEELGGKRQHGPSTEPVIPADIDRVEVEATARRMVALLDVMPSSWVPDLETMKDILGK
jgi:predicted RNA-binding Zn ribbon-like protein